MEFAASFGIVSGGWPILSGFSLPVSKLGVPRSCVLCKGGYDADGIMRFYACRPAPQLRCSSSALYHLFLLSVVAFSWHGAQSRLLSLHPRAITSALWLRGGGIRGHAGTFSLAHHRTGRRNSVYGDAGVEATHGSCSAAPRKRRDRRQRSLFPDEPRLAFWQARFYDFNLWTTKKRREKLRYMHRNPVKRGLVESPEQWRWSSYRFYCLGESGPVRINEGWGEISFRNRVA